MLQRGVYSNEYMDDWEKFNETSLAAEEDFYRHSNMEDITDADYTHFFKKLKKYHDLYIQGDTLLSLDVFENFRNMFINIYENDPAKFLSAAGLASQAALKKTKLKLELMNLLTYINLLIF